MKQYYDNFWNIEPKERTLFLLSSALMFLLIFNYTVLRNVKDALVITAPASGPEATCFLKGWFILPIAILTFALIVRLTTKYSRIVIFNSFMIFFILFYTVFCFFLYPNVSSIHPHEAHIMDLQKLYPSFTWVFSIYGNWTYSLYYIFSELWGSIMISFLFWEYVNSVVTTEQAKRFYPMFILISNLSLVLSGAFLEHVCINWVGPKNIGLTLQIVTISFLCFCLLSIYIYKQVYSLTKNIARPVNQKKPLGFMESIQHILSSKYLGYISILVVAYGVSINLIEVIWKKQLVLTYSDPSSYSQFMGRFTLITGIFTILMSVVSKFLLSKYKWITVALITPITVLFTGSIFFFSMMYKITYVNSITAFLSFIIIWIGAIQNFLSKSIKYALFDPTKEMAYIPLGNELKQKGKAAIDVIGERLGKAGGAYIQQVLFMLTQGSVLVIMNYSFALVLATCIIWIWAVMNLDQGFQSLLKKSQLSQQPT